MNRRKVETDKPKLKVKTQSVADDARKRLYLKSRARFELAAKGVFRLQGRCYIFRQGVPGLWASIRLPGKHG